MDVPVGIAQQLGDVVHPLSILDDDLAAGVRERPEGSVRGELEVVLTSCAVSGLAHRAVCSQELVAANLETGHAELAGNAERLPAHLRSASDVLQSGGSADECGCMVVQCRRDVWTRTHPAVHRKSFREMTFGGIKVAEGRSKEA